MSLILISALLLFISTSGFAAARLSLPFAILPLLLLVYKTSTPKTALWRSLAAGSIFFLAHISWFLSAAPLTWAGISDPFISSAVAISVWMASAAVLGLFTGFFGLALKLIPIQSWWFAAPALLSLTEYLRAWGFGIWWMGQESLLGPHWTFGALGYGSIHVGSLLNLSKLFGLYGLTFILAIPSVFFFYIFLSWLGEEITPALKKSALLLAVIIVAIISFGLYSGYFRPQTASPSKIKQVALIQSNFPSEFQFTPASFLTRAKTNWENVKRIKSANPGVELIVLPEGSLVTNTWNENVVSMLQEISGGKSLTLIDAAKVELNQPSPSRVYHIKSGVGLAAYNDKEFLIPGGEYLSYWGLWLARLWGAREWLNQYAQSHELKAGSAPPPKLDGRKQENGVLICSGAISPPLYYELSRSGAGVLVNTASLSIFKGNPLFLAQSEAMLRFIAASSDRYFLQAANGGLNYIINNRGEIVKKSAGTGFEPLVGNIEYRYTKYPKIRF